MALTREQTVGLFFLGGILIFVGFIEATVGSGFFSRGYRLWAEFQDVGGLGKGAQVRVGGVRVGTVKEIRLEPDRVRVGLQIQPGIEVRENAIARLDFQALSGTRFVAIDLGTPSAKPLPPDATIQSEASAGISEMVNELQKVGVSVRDLTESLNENQDRLLTNVNQMLEENREGFGKTMTNLNGITEKINSGEGTLGKLLTDSRLYDEALAALAELRDSFGDIRQVTGRLARGEGLLGHMLADDGLYEDLRETVASLNVTAQNFEFVSDQVRRGEGTLGKLVTDDALYAEAEGALKGVTRASQGIEDQAPISVLGTLIGTIF